jgi:hypothetical protein
MFIKVLQNPVNNAELNKLINNKIIFVGAFSKNCHHCINMKQEWIQFKKMARSSSSYLGGAILEIDTSVLSSIKNPLLTNNVNGFPSLFIIKNKKIIQYNNERTAVEFMKFFKSHMPKLKHKSKKKVYNPKSLRRTFRKSIF